MMIGIDPKDSYRMGKDMHIFNSDGHELQYSLPKETALSEILSLGEQADTNLDFKLNNFPKHTLLRFYKEDECGLCEPDGKVILPLQAETIEFWMPGFAFLKAESGNANSAQVKIFDFITGKVSLAARGVIPRDLLEHTRSRWREKRTGSLVQVAGAPNATFTQLSESRLKKTVNLDKGKFDAAYWSHNLNEPMTRQEMFSRFLQEYDLIGMPQDGALDLLGDSFSAEPTGYKGDLRFVSYALPSCAVKIHFKNDVVDYWQFSNEQSESAPITSNQILIPQDERTFNLLPSFPRTQMLSVFTTIWCSMQISPGITSRF